MQETYAVLRLIHYAKKSKLCEAESKLSLS